MQSSENKKKKKKTGIRRCSFFFKLNDENFDTLANAGWSEVGNEVVGLETVFDTGNSF